jgi:hypothetical protein
MNRNLTCLALVIVLSSSLCITPLLAHHAFSAEFDRNKPVKVEGIVKKVMDESAHLVLR